MASIQLLNLGEVLAGIKARQEKLNDIPKAAKQMGVICKNNCMGLIPHPLHVKSGNWRDSIHAEVHPQGSFKTELWFGSKGAFAASGYNYGALQERVNHPIEIAWHKSMPEMKDIWMSIMRGQGSSRITESISEGFEFASMAGF